MGRFGPNTWEPAVNVLTWFLMTTAILCVLTRLGTKFWIFRRWTTDDYLSIVSMVLCAAQSIALSMAIANGYGEHFDTLTGVKVEEILKVSISGPLLMATNHSRSISHSMLQLSSLLWPCATRN
jgi:hypothetical protein